MAPKKAAKAQPTRTSSRQADAATEAESPKPAANTKAKITKTPAANTKAKVAPKPAPETKAKVTKKAAAAPKKAAPAKTAVKARGRPKKQDTAATDAETDADETKTTKKATANGTTKKAPAKKDDATTNGEVTTKAKGKRKSTEDLAAPPAKKAKVQPKGTVINHPPTQRLHVYVFGEGSSGELGLGTRKNAVDVKRPRLNPNLPADKVGVVQIAAGGMHVLALTHDNKVLSWGVNDQGALGRDTTWEGGLKDIDDAESDDSDDDDAGLNPHESTPAAVEFTDLPEGTLFTQVVAGDSCSFALTDDGKVYGWGTFRSNEGIFGFLAEDVANNQLIQRTPKLIPDLKKIVSLAAGANHVLALDSNGAVFAWGSGQQNQLGRRVVERTKTEGLKPREFGLPKGSRNGIVSIETGSYHSFAIDKRGDVYGWGLNNYGETGFVGNAGEDDAAVLKPLVIDHFKGKTITCIKGGGHHSLAITDSGDCLIWGRIDGHQLGISDADIAALPEDAVVKDEKGTPRILAVPQKVLGIEGKVVTAAAASDHNIVITESGKAWSWGFSANYQTGQGTVDDVLVPTMIDNTAVREKRLTGAVAGGQYSILIAAAEEAGRVPNGVVVPVINGTKE